MSDLGPPLLGTEHDLQRAIAWVAEKMQRHGLEVTVRDDGVSKVLSEDALTATYQVVQELLFNVVKHAGVDEARVELAWDGGLVARVIDHGKGFDANELTTHAGFGVMSVRHRLDLLGGGMDIASTPGKGTTVTLHAPAESKANN